AALRDLREALEADEANALHAALRKGVAMAGVPGAVRAGTAATGWYQIGAEWPATGCLPALPQPQERRGPEGKVPRPCLPVEREVAQGRDCSRSSEAPEVSEAIEV